MIVSMEGSDGRDCHPDEDALSRAGTLEAGDATTNEMLAAAQAILEADRSKLKESGISNLPVEPMEMGHVSKCVSFP